MIFEKKCMDCNKVFKIEIDEKAFEKWRKGAHIQDVMPRLSADIRELLISGICGSCFDKIFPDE